MRKVILTLRHKDQPGEWREEFELANVSTQEEAERWARKRIASTNALRHSFVELVKTELLAEGAGSPAQWSDPETVRIFGTLPADKAKQIAAWAEQLALKPSQLLSMAAWIGAQYVMSSLADGAPAAPELPQRRRQPSGSSNVPPADESTATHLLNLFNSVLGKLHAAHGETIKLRSGGDDNRVIVELGGVEDEAAALQRQFMRLLEPLSQTAHRAEVATQLLLDLGAVAGEDHKQYALDQVLRQLTVPHYAKIVRDWETTAGYEWDCGTPP